jgi:2-polyprenyl-3-methyl-5-hydroxy-6-metoxy-1,4-benzoquinol methylase
VEQPDELVDELTEPVYEPFAYARSLLAPGASVLDVGCGNGKVGAYLAQAGALVDGVETAANRAGIARARLRYVSEGDPLERDDPGLRQQYDVITYFDVLEHLTSPERMLDWAMGRLTAGGRIVASVPNSAHHSFRRKILRGDWSLADAGLFDRTHVRFYDTRTAQQLCAAGGRPVRVDFSTPATGWQRACMRRRPNLFALHTILTWEKPGA